LSFMATSEEGYGSGAPHLAIHHTIQKYRKEGFMIDFEGGKEPGMARFYSGFGAMECIYLRVYNFTINPFVWIRALK